MAVTASTVAQVHQAAKPFGLLRHGLDQLAGRMRALGHSVEQVEHLLQKSAPHDVIQETCQQLEWARGGGNRETTASVENLEIQGEEVSKSSGQPSLGTAEVTSSRALEPSCDYVVGGELKQCEEPAVGKPVLTPSV